MNERDSMIGKSIRIKGEIAASEPLYILGSVEGTINAPNNRVTVGQGGTVNADIDGADRVEIRKDGLLIGNLAAHRISIEDGAVLQGVVDVRTPVGNEKAEATTSKPHVIRNESAFDPAEFTELQLAGD